MRKTQVMNLMLLPQAVKIMLPAIISQCVVALKDTALGRTSSRPASPPSAKQIYREFDNHIPTIIVIAAIYIVVNLILTWLATCVQKKFVGEKKVPLDIPMVGAARHRAGDSRTSRAGGFGVTQSLMTPGRSRPRRRCAHRAPGRAGRGRRRPTARGRSRRCR